MADEGFRAFKRTTILAYELSWNTLEFSNRCLVTLEEEDIQKKLLARTPVGLPLPTMA